MCIGFARTLCSICHKAASAMRCPTSSLQMWRLSKGGLLGLAPATGLRLTRQSALLCRRGADAAHVQVRPAGPCAEQA